MATATVVAMLTAAAHALRTQASRAKTLATATTVGAPASQVASVDHKPHAPRVKNSNVKTHAAPVLTWAKTSATTSTTASQPAMCQQASHHLACLRAAAVVVAEAAIVVAVAAAETSVEAAHAQVVVVVGEIQAAGFGASRFAASIPIKSSFRLLFYVFHLSFLPPDQ